MKTCLVNLSCSYVIITGQLNIHKALIVSKIQVHLSKTQNGQDSPFFFLTRHCFSTVNYSEKKTHKVDTIFCWFCFLLFLHICLSVPLHHHPRHKLLHVQQVTLFQHLCSSKDLKKDNINVRQPIKEFEFETGKRLERLKLCRKTNKGQGLFR